MSNIRKTACEVIENVSRDFEKCYCECFWADLCPYYMDEGNEVAMLSENDYFAGVQDPSKH